MNAMSHGKQDSFATMTALELVWTGRQAGGRVCVVLSLM